MTTSAVSNDAAKATPKIAGLTSPEAAVRLQKDGPNAMPDIANHPLRNALLDGVKIPIFARLQIS